MWSKLSRWEYPLRVIPNCHITLQSMLDIAQFHSHDPLLVGSAVPPKRCPSIESAVAEGAKSLQINVCKESVTKSIAGS